MQYRKRVYDFRFGINHINVIDLPSLTNNKIKLQDVYCDGPELLDN